MPGGFWPLPHAGHENPEADTHVESCGDVLSDAGSTPAASTNFFGLISLIQIGQAISMYLIRPNFRLILPRAADDLPAPSAIVQAPRQAPSRCVEAKV